METLPKTTIIFFPTTEERSKLHQERPRETIVASRTSSHHRGRRKSLRQSSAQSALRRITSRRQAKNTGRTQTDRPARSTRRASTPTTASTPSSAGKPKVLVDRARHRINTRRCLPFLASRCLSPRAPPACRRRRARPREESKVCAETALQIIRDSNDKNPPPSLPPSPPPPPPSCTFLRCGRPLTCARASHRVLSSSLWWWCTRS